MSLSAAFQNAMSGLRVAGRSSEVIASNIANAGTPGYAKRTLEISSIGTNSRGGVSISGMQRIFDLGLIAAQRNAAASFGYADPMAKFSAQLEKAIGTPENAAALVNRIADFEAALIAASSRPDAAERLDAAVFAAKDVVSGINAASKSVSNMRSAADSEIGNLVDRLNAALSEVHTLNIQVSERTMSRQDSNSLLDMRQTLIDEISSIIPLREIQRSNGQVALYAHGGAVLLDGSAATIEFDPVHTVTPHMSFANGTLSGLKINGYSVRTDESKSDIAGGRLAAQFHIRDSVGPDAVQQLDAVARDLVERFQDGGVDGTILAGMPGLFTDSGDVFAPANEAGLSERLSLNSNVDPSQGGESWRLRDGVGASLPGTVGDATTLNNLRGALSNSRSPSSGDFGTGLFSMNDVVTSLISRTGVQRMVAEQRQSFASAVLEETAQAVRAIGVDTDAELQNLMLVEQSYAANARMIEIVDEMMDTLMRLGA